MPSFISLIISQVVVLPKVTTSGSAAQFTPGNIHKEPHLSFWKNVLQPSPWVISVLEDGLLLPLRDRPPVYEEENNALARDNMGVVYDIVMDMIQKGIVKQVQVKPHCVAPLGLVSKSLGDGKMKHRLIYDASRCVNHLIEDRHVTLTGLDSALEASLQGDFQATFDLSSAYYHIKIADCHHQYLGAKIEHEGSVLYFVYQYLPFGIKCAVHAITKIMKPLIHYLHSMDIRMCIYIDDGRVLGRTKTECENNLKITYEVLSKCGWIIEPTKSTQEGATNQLAKYLGFLIDTNNMTVSSLDSKLQEIQSNIEELLTQSSVKVKGLAKVLGRIIATIPSHGYLARVATRSGYVAIEQHVNHNGWNGKLILNKATIQELVFFKTFCSRYNGRPIQTSVTRMRVAMLFPDPVVKPGNEVVDFVGNPQAHLMVSDASAFKVSVLNLSNLQSGMFNFAFTKEEKHLESGVRELLAVLKTLQAWKRGQNIFQKWIYWGTDSENSMSFLTKGSSKPHIQEICFEIAKLKAEMEITIQPVHLLRGDSRIQLVDSMSKTADTDDWSIDEDNFQWFKSKFGLQIDAFASASNARLRRFYSEFCKHSCEGTNAYAQCWENVILWCSPPVSELVYLANEIKRRKCEGVVILPDWKTSTFYNHCFQNGFPVHPFQLIKRFLPFVSQNQAAKAGLEGTKFYFFALYFKR